MDKEFISKVSIYIEAPIKRVWEALVSRESAKKYFWGAEVHTDWKVGRPIVFRGVFNGNKYEEKGIILQYHPEKTLQYSHWSNLEDLADLPENYRNWTFELSEEGTKVLLSITEDNIPTEKQKERSDEFWNDVLGTIKRLLEEE